MNEKYTIRETRNYSKDDDCLRYMIIEKNGKIIHEFTINKSMDDLEEKINTFFESQK
jgi:hypothetical protein